MGPLGDDDCCTPLGTPTPPPGAVAFPTQTSGDANFLTDITIDTPAGTVAGDILLFWIWRKPNQPVNTPPAGAYVELFNSLLLSFEAVRLQIWSYVAGAGEPPSRVFTSPTFADFNVWGCVRVSGAGSVGDTASDTNLDVTWTAPTVNVVAAGAGLLTFTLAWDTVADPSQTPVSSQATAFTPYLVKIGADTGLAPGPTGTRSAGCTFWEWFAANLVFEP